MKTKIDKTELRNVVGFFVVGFLVIPLVMSGLIAMAIACLGG